MSVLVRSGMGYVRARIRVYGSMSRACAIAGLSRVCPAGGQHEIGGRAAGPPQCRQRSLDCGPLLVRHDQAHGLAPSLHKIGFMVLGLIDFRV